ncbi:hypothetical protein CK203_037011 [Vitis vinifera]|uniref:Reverse transcriptase zinc-binding domain-containing protein n=1 Tax=Vitis vinifera TaxID=29760 RepID=A0A438IV10_VITVI|nr:hypothetical protein CK203_037011 [Vitis vinifera]
MEGLDFNRIDVEEAARLEEVFSEEEVFSALSDLNGDKALGCRVNGRSGDGALVSHLLFADDTLVFCEASEDQMVYLSWLLMWFEAISGLRINLDKSEILSVGRVENLEALALEVGCKVRRLPSSYLGIPLGANHKSVAVWDGVEERFRKRLVMWKRQFISKGGRITLIRSTFSRGALERKPHLVNWDTVCLDKRKGGLGVRRLSTLNKALSCKWNWRFANERENLWRHVISRKFGEEEGGWFTREVREGFGVGFWKEIRKKEAWVVELWDPSGEEEGRRLNPLLEDRMLWKETTNEIFSVKSLYNVLASRRVDQFPNSMIWSPCVPTKVSFFAWEASWGKVLTLDQLKKRGQILAKRCFLCCEEEKSIDHILIHCTRARVI